mgnify:FL=1
MGDKLGAVYSSLFENVYGVDLSDYIWGQSSPVQDANLYANFGFWMLATTVLCGILYYKVFDRYSLSHWWCWLIAMAVPMAFNFFYGYVTLANQYNEGLMIDEKQNDLGFTSLDFVNFGLANMLMSVLAFIGFTLIMKVLFKFTPLQSDCSQAPLCK